jgi:hypothetical protein
MKRSALARAVLVPLALAALHSACGDPPESDEAPPTSAALSTDAGAAPAIIPEPARVRHPPQRSQGWHGLVRLTTPAK